MEKVAVFIDYENISKVFGREKLQIDLLALRDYLAEGRVLKEIFCYPGPSPIDNHSESDLWDFLMTNGFLIRFQPVQRDGILHGDIRIQLVLDVVDYVIAVKPNIVVIVAGDGNYAPLATWLRRRGVRVEVASAPNTVSQDFKLLANGFIDLFRVLEQIQAGESDPARRKEVMTDARSDR